MEDEDTEAEATGPCVGANAYPCTSQWCSTRYLFYTVNGRGLACS